LSAFKCDRCGKIFHVEDDREPFTVRLVGGTLRGEEEIHHLCPDCEATFWCFYDNVEEFNRLADKLAGEEVM